MTYLTITCDTIPVFTDVFKSFKIFTNLDIKWKGVPDFRGIISKTYFTIANLIDFGKTEI